LIRIRFVLVVLLATVCSHNALSQEKSRVLFVGNSLTYFNNLPEIVRKVAASDGRKLTVESIAYPDYALLDHLAEGKVQKKLESGKYDFLVVQQGPSSQVDGKEWLLNAGFILSPLCKKYGIDLIFYMVWPARNRMQDFPAIYRHYKLAADTTQSIFSPAGQAWLEAWNRSPGLALYGVDNFHPSYNGSLLAAMVIYGSITRKQQLSTIEYEPFGVENISRRTFDTMVKAAETVLANTGK
jgi:hypothetical protein